MTQLFSTLWYKTAK